MYVRLLSLRGI